MLPSMITWLCHIILKCCKDNAIGPKCPLWSSAPFAWGRWMWTFPRLSILEINRSVYQCGLWTENSFILNALCLLLYLFFVKEGKRCSSTVERTRCLFFHAKCICKVIVVASYLVSVLSTAERSGNLHIESFCKLICHEECQLLSLGKWLRVWHWDLEQCHATLISSIRLSELNHLYDLMVTYCLLHSHTCAYYNAMRIAFV